MATEAQRLAVPKLQPVIGRVATKCLEQLQEGYVASVAATAGCTVHPQSKDVHGFDCLVIRSGQTYDDDETSIFLALKCSTKLQIDPSRDAFSYTFKERKYFDKLASRRTFPKALLVVMAAPSSQVEWTEADHDHLKIRQACYWRSLEGESAAEGVQSPSVRIPTANIFDAKALTTIMDRLDRGEELR